MQNTTECVTYQPDRPHYGCWPQTCHISDACWWEPTVCAGFSLSALLLWVMGVCSLVTQVRDIKTHIQGQDPDANIFGTYFCIKIIRNKFPPDRTIILHVVVPEADSDSLPKTLLNDTDRTFVCVFFVYGDWYEHVHSMIQQNHTVLNFEWLLVSAYLYQQLLYLWVGGPPVQSWSWHQSWDPQSDPSAYSAILKGAWSP